MSKQLTLCVEDVAIRITVGEIGVIVGPCMIDAPIWLNAQVFLLAEARKRSEVLLNEGELEFNVL